MSCPAKYSDLRNTPDPTEGSDKPSDLSKTSDKYSMMTQRGHHIWLWIFFGNGF
jgi:hypothetical protein